MNISDADIKTLSALPTAEESLKSAIELWTSNGEPSWDQLTSAVLAIGGTNRMVHTLQRRVKQYTAQGTTKM